MLSTSLCVGARAVDNVRTVLRTATEAWRRVRRTIATRTAAVGLTGALYRPRLYRRNRAVDFIHEPIADMSKKISKYEPDADTHMATTEHVRTYIEENVPDNYSLEEKKMFGMNMWMVRGNMFIGVGTTSSRMLVRVGEPNVEKILAAHPVGVTRCGAASGRVFKGTLMVEVEQYRGNKALSKWFDYAMAHNKTMVAKEPSDKPKKKRPRADDEEAEAPTVKKEAVSAPKPRPASTSGGEFARCVLHVIRKIPKGKVAAYGQVAALAGAPRNARQVGHMLKEGLCAGGAPWHRVLGSSGKISLPINGGGDRQRRLLEAEGVEFRESGAVAADTFWSRGEPFFAET